MTHEEILLEIEDLKKMLDLSSKISVESILKENQDLDFLERQKVTITPNGEYFRTDKQGFLSELMEKMYNDRTKYKKMMIDSRKKLEVEKDTNKKKLLENDVAKYNNLQLTKKVCLNSAYGSIGNPYFRFFDVRQASAITTAGQLSIRWIEKEVNEYLNKVLKTNDVDYCIASDTDSLYLTLDILIQKTILEKTPNADTKEIIQFMDKVSNERIQPFIDSSYDKLAKYLNVYAQKMVMKREALSDKAIWTNKKRYVLNVYNNEGVEYAKPKLKVMGLEIVRSSTPTSCRDKLKEAINVIMNKSEEDIIKFIDEYRQQFKKLPYVEISFPRGVNGISKYRDGNSLYKKGTPIHVRGSIVYNHMLKKNKLENKYQVINDGEKIKFIYLREPNPIGSNVICFPQIIPPEFQIENYIDYNLQFEKSFLEPIKTILDSIGWRTEKGNSLNDFFS